MIKEKSKELYKQTIKWIAISIILGIIVGLLVGLYNTLLSNANNFRKEKPWLIYFLPIAGILISYIYIKTKRNAYSGENLLKSEVQQAAKDIPFYMIIVSALGSLITTFFGGSAGKEGTAICIGGTIGDNISRILKVTEEEQKNIVICGVGSAFGVIYNVPFAGAILGMELVLKGKFHYQAILPSLMTSIVANETYLFLWNKNISYPEISLGEHNLFLIIKLIILGIIF